ncbi:hypothetical protein VT84_08610 [Gemmata sp. SH-PL17]|uniref:hypothetical protein n=1 Tax=Gemmata sp. SH-PL17 TaxID=1630693 RepID=UPI00078E61D5|nr:hypothetical protein [Gemmata sp. SH-PL17]AMV24445.1 hypothetical protein VT84_08610 [Gemmata sp. SH-PL17]
MLRKLILSIAIATLIGSNPVATAAEITPPTQPQREFKVFVLRESGWQLHGTYALHADARQAATRLWREGYRVEIWEVRGK